jgi:hypothetical protein
MILGMSVLHKKHNHPGEEDSHGSRVVSFEPGQQPIEKGPHLECEDLARLFGQVPEENPHQ